MNARDGFFLADIQSQRDVREIAIDAVGVRGLRYPVTLATRGGPLPTVATFALAVALGAEAKGTHMSRFVELLEARGAALDAAGFRALGVEMCARLGAERGEVEMRFPYFVRKAAPVSGVESLLDLDVRWSLDLGVGGAAFRMAVTVPATSLCPCSKEISAYGAHNQRSHITIEAEAAGDLAIEDLVAIAERSASCEVYGLLKRPDEKHVTERAYDNPKFVEDLVRDVALALDAEPRVAAWSVTAENFESIHNHSAFARIARGRR